MLRSWKTKTAHPYRSVVWAGWSAVAPLIVACALFNSPSRAEDLPYNTRTTYGEVGILEMPSSRMAPDGELSVTLGILDKYQRINSAFQILPWLEASFRYSHIPGINGVSNYYDRSFGLKLRLGRESEYFPEISLGARDILGTGVYAGEYLVASKQFREVDVTFGVGWGRLAQVATFANPLAQIFPSFRTRAATAITGGTVNFGDLFHGKEVGLFGGAVWRTPIDNLDLLLEYSSDRYSPESLRGGFKVRLPVNIGASYRIYNIATVSAGWYYGTSYGVTLTLNAEPTIPSYPIGPDIVPPVVRSPKQQIDALSALLDHSKPNRTAMLTAPWVQLPLTKPDTNLFALESALMSVGMGVHDIDVAGRTLMVDADLTQSANGQCDRYASIVSSLDPHLETIALSNLHDSSGKVAICTISHNNDFTDNIVDDGTPQAADNSDGAALALNSAAVEEKIRRDVSAQSLHVEGLAAEPEMVWLYFANGYYSSEAEAAGRIARILMTDAPPSAEIFHIVSVRDGMALRDFQVVRSALERATATSATPIEMAGAVSLSVPPLSNPILDRAMTESYPRYHWSVSPALREGFFDPARPVQFQLLGAINAGVDITPQLTLEGRGEVNIFDTYDLKQLPDSLLPHVRSDFVQYFRHGINGIAKLQAVYRMRLTPDVFFEAKAGYLEDMFAGGGVQMLWRPEGQRFSIGVDVYQVWQRNFDRLFGLQNYHVLTGHVSVYYESPWYNMNLAVHAGRYLAGDYGATVEITRRFSTGIEVGAFATFTNVPFAKFGEGSFDKGIVIHIPLEWALPFFTQTSYDLLLRSLTRDGGQPLDDDNSLFEETRPTSYGEVIGHIDEVTAP